MSSSSRRAPRPFKPPKYLPLTPRKRPQAPAPREPEAPVEAPRVPPEMPPVLLGESIPLGLGVAMFYGASARNRWVYDDYPLIVDAAPPQSLSALAELATRTHWNALPYYRPLSRLLLGAEQMLFGLEPTWYHLFNAALMGCTATLAYALLRTPGLRVEGPFALLGALLVALHPAASEAVYPASVGPETLASFAACMGAVLAWLRAGAGAYGTALALLAVALLFKEQSVAVPLLFVACDALDLSHDAPGRSLAKWRARYVPVAVVLGLWFALRAAMITAPGPAVALWQDPAGPLRAMLYTAQSSLLPRPDLAYEPSVEGWLRFPHTALALLAALGVGAWLRRWRDALRTPIRFWGAWFVIAVLPTANLFRQETAYAERYVLFALPAAAGVIAALTAALAQRSRRAGLGALALCVGLLGVATLYRGRFYRDQVTFLQQWRRTEPHPHRALASLGEEAHKRRDWPEAERYYREAYAAAPALAGYVHAPLGQVLEAQGLRDDAIAEYRAALRSFPDNQVARVGLTRLGAAAQLREGDAQDASALLNFGVAEIEAGRREEGIARLREALRLEPVWQGSAADHARIRSRCHYNIARALNELSRTEEAIAAYRAALEVEPGYAYANTNLALILEQRGEREEAVRRLRTALQTDPSLAIAREALDRLTR